MRLPTPYLVALAVSLTAPIARAEDPAAYAHQLAELRASVEDLSQTLDTERDALRTDLRATELRRTELETQIRQEELRVAELQRELDRQRAAVAEDATAYDTLAPTVLAGLDRLIAQVKGGLPYRLDERVAALTTVRDQVAGKLVDPRVAVGRVWQAIEDELRLGRENVLDRQVLTVGGQEMFVQVARLGMVALYFRTEDGRVGAVQREGAEWTTHLLDDPQDAVRVNTLFAAFDKQQRVGWFELPFALPEVSP